MKILFLSSRIPYPPDRGDKVRTLFFLRELNKLGELTLVSLVDKSIDAEAMSVLEKEIPHTHFIEHTKQRALKNMVFNIPSKTPFQVAYYKNSNLMKKLQELKEENHYDLVYTHLIRMVPYAKIFSESQVILDYTDCISLEYKRSLEHISGIRKLFFSIESERTAKYELATANLFAENWVISPVDISTMGLKDHKRSLIMPNQVYIPEKIADSKLKNRLVFTGNMSVPHNVVAAENVANKIMPALLREYPQLNFYIVGANPSAEIKALHGKNNTHVLGFVDDLYEELYKSDIFVAPLYFSAGIQNKALEAMACGIPVVTTPNVVESLKGDDEVDIMSAEDNNAFVEKIKVLLDNEQTRAQIGKSGRALIAKTYSCEAVTELIAERVNILTEKN
ncbi:MAG TPA: glycosyltransferase [Candidatus Cloacimonetes bacterium]|nr:glycosyltransferase [Candidatus Cloacimonadota bacterium]